MSVKFRFSCTKRCCGLPCTMVITEGIGWLSYNPNRIKQAEDNLKNVCPQKKNETCDWKYIGYVGKKKFNPCDSCSHWGDCSGCLEKIK